MKWIIGNVVDNTFWSNELGWVDKASATRFDSSEVFRLNLPIGGIWEPDYDSIPRN